MKILFTGASSFTGMWFVRELALAGHTIVAPLFRHLGAYAGTRKERIDLIAPHCTLVPACPFGSGTFFELIASEKMWDLFCHHAADVANYKSPGFDYHQALARNTANLSDVLDKFIGRDCRRVVLTGSVFEPGEGAGTDDLRAVSPYGLSKGLTAEVFKFHCHVKEMSLGKFVIPNPFGPYEEERFTSFLTKTWLEGKCAPVTFPAYVRDNIHVSLLAKAYRASVEALPQKSGFTKTNPSGYAESQGAFTDRFAKELRPRLGVPCEFELYEQTDFTEPRERVNTNPVDGKILGWDEKAAWDELAEYYRKKFYHKEHREEQKTKKTV